MIPNISNINAVRTKHRKVLNLQRESHQFFYDSVIANVNDSLASILAICDNQDKEVVDKVKSYIFKINSSLSHIKGYKPVFYELDTFDVQCALKALIHVLKRSHQQHKFIVSFAEVHFSTLGKQASFEQLFLYIVNSLLQSGSEIELLVDANRISQNFVINITRSNYVISEELKDEILKFKNKTRFNGTVSIANMGKDTDISIQLPIKFKGVKFNHLGSTN